MQYFKEDRNGVSEVCTLVEEFAEDRAKEKVIDIAKELIARNMSTEDIVAITHLTEEEVKVLCAEN